jgi:hypothetical protein
LKEAFDAYNGDYLAFEAVDNPLSKRPDLHAFLLLDRLVPGTQDIVSAATHDEFYLQVAPDDLRNAASEEDIHDLVRCGVMYSEDDDALSMFT